MDSPQLTAWLTLQAVDGVGDRTLLKLINALGSPQAVLAASAAELVSAGCSSELAASIVTGPAHRSGSKSIARSAPWSVSKSRFCRSLTGHIRPG